MLSQAVFLPTRVQPARPCRRTRRLRVEANTLWALSPEKSWCSKHPTLCSRLSPIDLTNAIGAKHLVSVGSADFSSKSEEVCDFVVLDHGGIHVLFEAEGASNPLDSPSVLYITDVDSACQVAVNGEPLPKKKRTRLAPGAVLQLGNDACYQVLRNVFAHA